MANAFRAYGEIAWAYTTRKHDKEGQIFGFVSFKDVRNQEDLFKDVSKGGSFADILLNKTCPALEEELIDIDPVNTLTGLVGRELVGRLLNFNVLRFLNVMLVDVGYHEAVIQYLGGFSVLISFTSREETERLAENNKVWGIQSSQLQEDDGDLSTNVLGILTDNGNKIAGEVVRRWKDKHYRVWISEDPSPWIPDCLEKVGQSVGVSSEFEVRPGGKEKPKSVARACSEKEEEEFRKEEGSDGIPMQGSNHHHVNEVFSFSVPEKEYQKEVGPKVNDNGPTMLLRHLPGPRKDPEAVTLFLSMTYCS
ncbi:hypothetical protein Hanom_Chr09g00775101 [Helianthus anomalus]